VPRAVALATGPLLLAAWYGYVHATLHHWPSTGQSGNLGAPLTGWNDTLRYAHRLSSGDFDQSQIGALTAPVLVALATLLLAAAVVAVRMRTVASGPLLGLVAVTACQGWRTLLYPHEIFRTPAVATVLAVAVLAASSSVRAESAHAGGDDVGELAGARQER
jgi:hypothetical protein